jgi:hypothetical protein
VTQRHEEAKRERRRAEREDEFLANRVRLALASTKDAAHHIEQLRAHERSAQRDIINGIRSSDTHEWRIAFIEGHAIRAIVAALRELLS